MMRPNCLVFLFLTFYFHINTANNYLTDDITDNSDEYHKKQTMTFKRNYGQEINKLEDYLLQSWHELDRMLFCTKMPMCVIRYRKKYKIGEKDVKANLIQSLTLTIHQIKDITTKIKKLKR